MSPLPNAVLPTDLVNRFDDAFGKYIWTGVALNGAALLGLLNLLGALPDPDHARRVLTPSFCLLLAGLICGGWAYGRTLVIAGIRLLEAHEHTRMARAFALKEGIRPATSEMPMSLELAEIIYGEQAKVEIARLYAEVTAGALKQYADADAVMDEAQRELDKNLADMEREGKAASRLYSCSIGCCAGALALLLAGPLYQSNLAPPSKAELPKTVSQPASPLKLKSSTPQGQNKQKTNGASTPKSAKQSP